MKDINLNSQEIEHELLVSDFFHRAGLPAPQVSSVSLFFQGAPNARYVLKQQMDGDFATLYYGGGSDSGNLYRGVDPSGDGPEADFELLGESVDEYRPLYLKRNHVEEDDFSDVIELCRVFDRDETPDDVFTERLEAIVDVHQWARFFAAQACLANDDGGIQSSSGEDYFLYRINDDSNRADAGKWHLIPWDIEESYSDDDERLCLLYTSPSPRDPE